MQVVVLQSREDSREETKDSKPIIQTLLLHAGGEKDYAILAEIYESLKERARSAGHTVFEEEASLSQLKDRARAANNN